MATWILSPTDVRLLLEASASTRESARDRAILCLCLDAGLRRREIPGLRVGDVDLERGVISVTAGGDVRHLRVGRTTLDALAPFVRGRRPPDPLLVSRSGAPVTERTAHEQLRRLGELAGMGEWVTNRHTRHTFVATIAGGYPAPVVLRLAGHAGHRVRPTTANAALLAQWARGGLSPLDQQLAQKPGRRAA